MKEILVYGFIIFILCSFIGYFLEVLWVFLINKKFINRGFLCGPVVPIYGVGAVLILFCLFRYYDDPVVVFVFGVIITSALEYFISFLMEKLFCNKWWDYSSYPYNLNGRICLRNSFAFGVLSLVMIYFVMPLFAMLFKLFSFKVWTNLAIVLAVLFVLDMIYSIYIAYNLRNRIIIVEELKNQKLAMIPVIFDKKLKELTEGFRGFPNRLLKAFPDLEKQYHNYFEKMKKYKEQEKLKKKKKKESLQKIKK